MMYRLILAGLCIHAMAAGSGRVITNAPTPQHREIGRTSLGLVLPEGFSESSAIGGYENAEKKAQLIAGKLSFPFAVMDQGLKEEMKGDHVRILESLKINGYDALLVKHLEKANDGISEDNMVIMLVFGDQHNVWQVSCVYPSSNDGALGLKVEKALLTTVLIEDDSLEDPMPAPSAFAWYGAMGLDPGDMKLANKLGASTLFFNKEGKIPTTYSDTASFTVSRYAGTRLAHQEASLQKLRSLNPENPPVVETTEEIEVAGMKGLEIIAYIGEGESRELVYQATLFGATNYYRLVGRAEQDQETRIQAFRNMTDSFQVK